MSLLMHVFCDLLNKQKMVALLFWFKSVLNLWQMSEAYTASFMDGHIPAVSLLHLPHAGCNT